MSNERAFEILKDCLAKVVNSDISAIGPDTDLIEDGIIDSLDSMSLLFEIEQKIGEKLPEITDDYEDFRVGSLVDIVAKHI